jgi:23S rRNA (cytidine2498-2'-O)-methyltransferase
VRAYLVSPGFEEALSAELASAFAERTTLVPGVVVTEDLRPAAVTPPLDPVFARQVLPAAVELAGTSVRALAEAAYAAVEAAIDRWPGSFTMHAFAPPAPPPADAPTSLPAARLAHSRARAAKRAGRRATAPPKGTGGQGLASRVALIERELLTLLTERRRRASRRHHAALAPGDLDGRRLLVQLLITARERLVVSACPPMALPRGGFDLAPWPGGMAPVADDRAPPSRAYQKLEEAFLWLGDAPRAGQTCVDLGAAPGSWTMMALRRGARVIAVDRAPLAAALARAPGLTTIAGDAFSYEPTRPVDWLLSDVVCEPARAISLVDDWLTQARCRNLVVTVKFRGRADYGRLDTLGAIFDRVRPGFARVKQLAHNKNEVTVMVRAF